MATKIRMRCPGCGMLVDQKRLSGIHDFEIIVHQIGSRGRGKIYNVYRKPNKIEGQAFKFFKVSLAAKFYEIADRLQGKVGAEYVDAEYVDTDDDRGDEEWRSESASETVFVPEVLLEDLMEAESVEEQEPETVVEIEITSRTLLED